LMTSAPWSPRMSVAQGPDIMEERSTILIPANGPLIGLGTPESR
jgi:hypothetical protein